MWGKQEMGLQVFLTENSQRNRTLARHRRKCDFNKMNFKNIGREYEK